MTENKTKIFRGKVVSLKTLENYNGVYHSVSIYFKEKNSICTFHGLDEKQLDFFRDAMKNSKTVLFPNLPDDDVFPYYCFDEITNAEKE